MPQHITLVVASAVPAGPGILRLRLQDPDGWPLPKWRPGAHVNVQVPGLGPRAYSLCGDTVSAATWEIAVKREAASRGGSTWLHDVLKAGDRIATSIPKCTFSLVPDAARHVMIAGGIGVTPFLAMAHELERRRADWSLHVLYRHDAPCADELAKWQEAGRATLHDTARKPRPGWDALLGTPGAGVQAYCCGPEAMLAGFEQATARWPAGTAYAEYLIPPALLPSADAKAYAVRRAPTGEEGIVATGESLLTALRALGAKVDASCEGGICGTCEVRWLEGEPIHRDRVLSPERWATHLIACVAQCASDRLVVEA